MKTLNTLAIFAITLGMAFTFSSCDKDKDKDPVTPTDVLDNYTKIGTQAVGSNLQAHLYFAEAPFTGYNKVAVRVTEAGSTTVLQNATVSFLPMMDMGSMKHSTPWSDPDFDGNLNAYTGSVTFIMPGTASQWAFNVIVEANGNAADTATFNIDVITAAEARLYSFISAQDSVTSYFVALKEPMDPKIGLNDFELMIYKRETMMSFPAATDLKVEIEPTMPAMGHGSPNNQNPVHVGDGLYSGKVNFTMSGYWQVDVRIMDSSDSLLHEGFFDITFQ